jgi:hypothetical protein
MFIKLGKRELSSIDSRRYSFQKKTIVCNLCGQELHVDVRVNEKKALFGHYGQTCIKKKTTGSVEDVSKLSGDFGEDFDCNELFNTSLDPIEDMTSKIVNDLFLLSQQEYGTGMDGLNILGDLPLNDGSEIDTSYAVYQKMLYFDYIRPILFFSNYTTSVLFQNPLNIQYFEERLRP